MLNRKGAELLKKVIIKKYGEVKLDNLFADENEFYFEFKIDDSIGKEELQNLEKEMTNENMIKYMLNYCELVVYIIREILIMK